MSALKHIKVKARPVEGPLPEHIRKLVTSLPLKRLTIDLPEDLHAALKQRAALERTTIRELVMGICKDILARDARPTGPRR